MEKQCNNCKVNKDITEFYTVNKRNKPTIYHICKICCAEQKLMMHGYYRDWELKNKYGITLDTYTFEVNKRNNHCDICNEKVKTLHVDHCHTSLKIRGYLCGSCNRGLGLLKESSVVLKSAMEYLDK